MDKPTGYLSSTCTCAMPSSPYIRAAGQHRSGNIWVTADTEAGYYTLTELIDDWLPELSEQLWYSHKNYPVLVHGFPISFSTSHNSNNVNEYLIEDNMDIFTCLSALRSFKCLGNNGGQAPQKLHSSLVLEFMDPAIVNTCINHHVTFHSSLLPAIKFICHPPHCFNCHHTGHFTHSCGARSSCGLSMGDHDTRKCRASQNDRPAGLTPLKCAVCSRPHTAFDNGCPAHKATIDEHRIEITNAGPYFPILSQCAIPGPFPGHGFQ